MLKMGSVTPSSEKMGNATPYANKKLVACSDNKTFLIALITKHALHVFNSEEMQSLTHLYQVQQQPSPSPLASSPMFKSAKTT